MDSMLGSAYAGGAVSRSDSTGRRSGVVLQRILAGLAIVASLSLLGFLLWNSLRNPVETGLHVVRLEQLDQAARAEADLTGRLDQSRLDLESGAADLGSARDRFETSQRSLGTGQAGLGELGGEVGQNLGRFSQAAREWVADVDIYNAELERLSLLFAGVRDSGVGLLAMPAVAASESLSDNILLTIEEATAYSLRGINDGGAALQQLLGELIIASGELQDETARRELGLFVDAVDGLRFTRDALQEQRDKLSESRQHETLQSLYNAYQDYFNSLQNTASRHRQTLAAYAVALLLAFGLIAIRLRSSFSALDAMNDELQNANVNLELIVEERTEDLSQALQDLRTQQAQLIQSEKMASLGQMVAGVAHEINTPLGYANSNVEIIRDSMAAMEDSLDKDIRDEFDMLLADAQYGLEQIGELVMSLKNFSRVDRSLTELFNINDGLETSIKICHNQLKDRVTIQRHFAELPDISCAPSQLNQVFLNLINNAAQAIDGDGTITLTTRSDGEDVLISVRDTGCGMDEETRAHIFEPFFTTKPVGEGTGLGLSIVFRIIEDHGGTISVESAPGQGTEFLIRLPVSRSGAAPASSASVVLEQEAPA